MIALLLVLQATPPGNAAPQPAPRPALGPLFVETGSTALPGVFTTCGGADKETILEVDGGGLCLADFDVDGDTDLVVVDGSTLDRFRRGEPGFPPTMHLNRGDGTFAPGANPKPASEREPGEADWTLSPGRWGMGGAVGDVNGDGLPDLAITEWGPDRLLLNRGDRFEEVTETSGFRGSRWSSSATFLDYDLDGQLDLATVSYLSFRLDEIERMKGNCKWKGVPVMCGPEGLTPVHDVLYRGNGDGTFEDATAAAGYRPAAAGYGLGITTLDLDVDGDTDLYVTNDSTPNHLWRNQGDGTFREMGQWLGVAHDPQGKEQAGMGIGAGDLNGDGKVDLFVTNFSGENNALYLSGRKSYKDRSARSRLDGHSMVRLGWGTAMADFDLDRDLDLAVFNGHVYPQADLQGMDTSYAQPDFLYRNAGEARFQPEPLSDADPSVSRACAAADLDGDGWLDLVAIDIDGPVRVLRNRGAEELAPGESRHWLGVRLRARGGNTDGLGARVTVEAGGASQTAEIRTSGGYQAAVPPIAHFGLGDAAAFERLIVRWPSGVEQVLEGGACDRMLVIEEPTDANGEESR